MSSQHETFISLALAGKVMVDEIDDYIDRWHATPEGVPLHEYLGFSRDEYGLWLRSPDSLPLILASRKFNKPLHKIANDSVEAMRLAARASDPGKVKLLEDWLSKRTPI